jgi:O-methyltransferase
MDVGAALRRAVERVIDFVVVPPVRHIRALQKLTRYVAQEVPVFPTIAGARRLRYAQLRATSLDNGAGSRYDRTVRARLVEAFELVDREVQSKTTPSDGLFLAEAVLSLDGPGDLVECGCYAGASTAKLSLLAEAVGRRLHVFDSFEGLPVGQPDEVNDHDLRYAERPRWRAGVYGGGLEVVRTNVERYGSLGRCSFHRGWFADTLTPGSFSDPVALAFVDVDMVNSVRDCLAGLWPRLEEGGVFFSHDVTFLKVLRLFSDVEFWQKQFGAAPPILFGAGFGICDDSPHLGFCVKGREADADYVASLILYKGLPGGV